jgi:hypothetical protein
MLLKIYIQTLKANQLINYLNNSHSKDKLLPLNKMFSQIHFSHKTLTKTWASKMALIKINNIIK